MKFIILFISLISFNYGKNMLKNITAEYIQSLDKRIQSLFNNYDSRKCAYGWAGSSSSKKKFYNETDYHTPKPNKITKKRFHKRGKGKVSYIFDYLDQIFQNEITTEFERIWKEAKEIKIMDKTYEDAYDINKIMTIYNKIYLDNKFDFDFNLDYKRMSIEEVRARMSKISPQFNFTIWNNSINMQQINSIIYQWKYFENKTYGDYAKYVVDFYDMDGDGRLNPREFILFTIHNNYKFLGNGLCKNCYMKIFKEKLDAIFEFIDCNQSGDASTEDLWEGLSFIKRENPEIFNMYKCNINGAKLRTPSINALILKNSVGKMGYLDKQEFVKGILLGFWDRQTDKTGIYKGDQLNNKHSRWGQNGTIDIFCETLKKIKIIKK
jgi:hypothetical protein